MSTPLAAVYVGPWLTGLGLGLLGLHSGLGGARLHRETDTPDRPPFTHLQRVMCARTESFLYGAAHASCKLLLRYSRLPGQSWAPPWLIDRMDPFLDRLIIAGCSSLNSLLLARLACPPWYGLLYMDAPRRFNHNCNARAATCTYTVGSRPSRMRAMLVYSRHATKTHTHT